MVKKPTDAKQKTKSLIANYKFVKVDMTSKAQLISDVHILKDIRSEIKQIHKSAKEIQELEALFVNIMNNTIVGDQSYNTLVSDAVTSLDSIVNLADKLEHQTYDQLIALTQEYKTKVTPFANKGKPQPTNEAYDGQTPNTEQHDCLMKDKIALWLQDIDMFYGRFKQLQTQLNKLDIQDARYPYELYMLFFKVSDAHTFYHIVFDDKFRLEFQGFLCDWPIPEVYANPYDELNHLVKSVYDLVSRLRLQVYQTWTKQSIAQYWEALNYRYALDERSKLLVMGDDQDYWGCDLKWDDLGPNHKLKKASYRLVKESWR